MSDLEGVFDTHAVHLVAEDAARTRFGRRIKTADEDVVSLGQDAGLPMSDVFSCLTRRAVTRYHDGDTYPAGPVLSAPNLKNSALDMDDGDKRAVKTFPVVLPLEPIDQAYQRALSLSPRINVL